MIQSYYVCPRFVTVGLGSRWHNWSPNVATVTGWTNLPNREVPVLWDISCINNQTPGRSNVSCTRVCLATAAGILLISPDNMQRTNAIVRRGKFPSVFYSCDHLGEFCTSSLRALLYRASQQTLLCASKYILRLTKSYPVDRGFVIESKNIITNISSVQSPRLFVKLCKKNQYLYQ